MKYILLALSIVLTACSHDESPLDYNDSVAIEHKKIVFVGNSITKHAPKESIGWNGDHGMAATIPENDYVHLLSSRLNADFDLVNIAEWERNPTFLDWSKFDDVILFEPDLIVINLGENMVNSKRPVEHMIDDITELYLFLQSQTSAEVVIVNSFWDRGVVNESFFNFATNENLTFVDISDLATPDNMALDHWHEGVAAHPNDKGHAAIADRIFNAL